jgi:hypothetical protein
MTRMILDPALLSKLRDQTQPLELCDESGKVVGRFFPAPDLTGCEPLEPQISAEELQRRRTSGERRYSTAEVLAHLERQ